VRGLKLAYVGDGNNVANSLLLCCARLGIHMSVATPAGYEPPARISEQAIALGHENGAGIEITNDPAHAVRNAHAVYTDVWASMGQESEADERKRIFGPYQVNEALLEKARKDALFMHCLPAKRGQEVTDAVVESPQSVVFDQAENRLHVQKAALLMLLT
jgi:ornithine carbamoyltransferase